MGLVGEAPGEKRRWTVLFNLGILAGLVLRAVLASAARMPGHGDSAFYFTVAKNIASGRGPVVDYITYFFSGLLPLTHYAGDFWNPTAAFIIAIPMLLFGQTVQAALVAPIIAGVVPGVVGFLAGRRYTGSTALGALTGILTFFAAFEVWFSVTTEAIIFAGAFAAIAIYLMMKGSQDAGCNFLLAAVFTGLANLIRQDNILLLITLEVCILATVLPRRRKALLAAAALGIHLLVLSPLLAMNYAEMHTLFPPGPAKTAFLTSYEDFHSYNKRIDWTTLRATWGISGILKRRLHTATENLGQVRYFLTPLLTLLFILSLIDLLTVHRNKDRLRLLLPAALFALLEYAFYTLVASFSGPGSLIKSLAALLPLICMAIVGMLSNVARSRAALTVAVVVVAAYSAYQGYSRNLSSTLYYNGVYEQYGQLRSMVVEDASRRGLHAANIVILARDTWDVYEGTGFRTVMVPNNDVDTIVSVADNYGASYLLLPADRPQLDKIYTGLTPDPRFTLVGRLPGTDWKLFRLQTAPPG
jgi:dolichyl-phosphate-mannose-protein mannosyltransferase